MHATPPPPPAPPATRRPTRLAAVHTPTARRLLAGTAELAALAVASMVEPLRSTGLDHADALSVAADFLLAADGFTLSPRRTERLAVALARLATSA